MKKLKERKKLQRYILRAVICMAVCITPFVITRYYADLFAPVTISGYRFLYKWATRKFWYVWVMPVALALSGLYHSALFFTACTFLSAFVAQFTGDLNYLYQFYLIENGVKSYPYANHFFQWIIITVIVFALFIALRCFFKLKPEKILVFFCFLLCVCLVLLCCSYLLSGRVSGGISIWEYLFSGPYFLPLK